MHFPAKFFPRKACAVLCACALPLVALANPGDEAAAAFRAGDFATAAALFEQAIAAGDNSDATRYNLAVSQFRQNDVANANANFRLLYERGLRSADLLYSLAVTEKLLGNTQAAATWFTLVAASNSSLADEALAQLQALDGNFTSAVPVASSLRSTLQVSAGYNDAIVEVQDGKLIRNGDRYAETTAALAWQQPRGMPGLNLNFTLYNNAYADTPEQDFSLVGAGLRQTLPAFNKALYWTFDVDASRLDDQGFQQSFSTGLGLERNYSRYAWRTAYRYRISDSLNGSFDAFAGRHHQVQADYRLQPFPRQLVTLRASYEWIEREPLSNGESTLDLSRDIGRIDLAWSYQLAPTLQAIAGISYGELRSDAYQSFRNGTRLERDDASRGYSLSLRKNLGARLMLQAAYNRTDNRSTLADFTYDQSVYEVGFAWAPDLRL